MKIIIKNRTGRGKMRMSGYIKSSNFNGNAHIFLSYNFNPKIIEEIQKLLLKHYDLVEQFRGRLNKDSPHRPKFSKHLDKNVKVSVWNQKKSKYELVKIKDMVGKK